MQLSLPIPPEVAAVLDQLRSAGAGAWIVGGAVRDALVGIDARDWDIATTARPEVVAALLPDADATHQRLGALALRRPGITVAVQTLREEAGYTDHRHPDRVVFVSDPARDAVRRDFTANAIYVEPGSGQVFDPVGGVADLAARLLRSIGDARVRFAEDPLRMLRAVRVAARCQLQLHGDVSAALAAQAELLRSLAPERVFDELTRAFVGRGCGDALRLLVDTGLAAVVLPEVVAMDGVPQPPEFHPEGDVLTHVCAVLDRVRADDPVQAWAAVLHDVGKPATFERARDRIRFSGHDVLSAEMAARALRRLRAPRALTEAVVEICRHHIRFASLPQMGRSKRERWLRSPRFKAHLDFHRADCAASHGDLRIYDLAVQMLEQLPPIPARPLATGKDVLALGVAPGPQVGRLLGQLRDRLDACDEPDRPMALAILRELVESEVQGKRMSGR